LEWPGREEHFEEAYPALNFFYYSPGSVRFSVSNFQYWTQNKREGTEVNDADYIDVDIA